MEEKEIDKILKSQRKLGMLVALLVICLSIAIVCIGLVFYKRAENKVGETVNLSEVIANSSQKEGQYVELEIDSVPIFLASISGKEAYLYYVVDVENHIYIMTLSNETFKKITKMYDAETGKLNTTYQLKGVIKNIDDQIKELALSNSYKVFGNTKINSDNFSQYLGKIYVEEKNGTVTERAITLYKISALIGVFFLILAFGYIVPTLIKAIKVFEDRELIDELRTELENLTDTPYQKMKLYLTKNYIISGVQVMKYEDIVWAYIMQETKYGIKIGENLIVHTKDNKKHIVGSVAGSKNNILDTILEDIKSRNPNIRMGYNEENKEYSKSYKE